AGDLAAKTPKTRDRYVDFLRVTSLVVVMLGHWLMAVVVWTDGRLHTSNVLETTASARWLTWLFQVMPVFFIVGGFSNSASLAAGGAVLAVDVARWGFDVPMVGWLNLGLVWLFAHQLGVAWRTGSVGTWSRGRLALVAAAGMGTLVVLTSMFGYPGSMVGGVE